MRRGLVTGGQLGLKDVSTPKRGYGRLSTVSSEERRDGKARWRSRGRWDLKGYREVQRFGRCCGSARLAAAAALVVKSGRCGEHSSHDTTSRAECSSKPALASTFTAGRQKQTASGMGRRRMLFPSYHLHVCSPNLVTALKRLAHSKSEHQRSPTLSRWPTVVHKCRQAGGSFKPRCADINAPGLARGW